MAECNPYSIEPFFLPFGKGSLFCIFLEPIGTKPAGGILYLPPFAEEMHKSRRMASVQARRFAQAGYAVLQVDLLGCGDSTGDFENASWTDWLHCGHAAHAWMLERLRGPIILWGLRLGATLAVNLSCQLSGIAALFLWQPIVNGENFLNQFLRIRIASEMLAGQQDKSGITQLRKILASGSSVEVGGYMISPVLAAEVDKLRLAEFPVCAPLYWLDVLPSPSSVVPPATTKTVQLLIEAGVTVHYKGVPGEAFWSTQEIAECRELLTVTADALQDLGQ